MRFTIAGFLKVQHLGAGAAMNMLAPCVIVREKGVVQDLPVQLNHAQQGLFYDS